MAIAISLWFDEALEQSIRRIWGDFATREISASLHDGPYRPHITLGAFDVPVQSILVRELRKLANRTSSFPLRLDASGIFHNEEGVLFLSPIMTKQLLSIHDVVFQLASEIATPTAPYYTPGAWTPHCTLAWRVPMENVLRGVSYLSDAKILPLTGNVVAIGVIETPAEIELNRLELLNLALDEIIAPWEGDTLLCKI